MKMTNRWNTFIYRLWAPIYDSTVNHFFMPGRRRALEILALQPGERVFIAGVGTGADLPFLPEDVEAIGIDISPEMLEKARRKLPNCVAKVKLVQGDAQAPLVEKASFEAAILNLILSVIPDGKTCLEATLQVLKPGGRVVVFDKFLGDEGKLTVGRQIMNWFSTLFGTDITRRFSDMCAGYSCRIIHDEPSLMHGVYRVILIQKIGI